MIQNNILVSNNNSDSNSLRFFSSLCETNSILQPSWGTGPATFSRASAQYVTDFEGVTRKVESGSVAVEGSRVVTNLLTYSEDLSNAAWSKYGTTTITGTNIVNVPAIGDRAFAILAVNTNQSYVLSALLSGSGTIDIQLEAPGAATVTRTVTLSSIPARYYISSTSLSAGNLYVFPVRRNIGRTATSVTVHSAQLENVTGQTNQNPGEYVKTTSAAVTKCFSTTNGNTVNGTTGVVTEATGTSLPTSYSERQNSTAYALGDKIQVSGWWYECTTAGTSDSSAPAFPQGKAGSQTVTDGTAVWTIGGRLLLGYVSEPASTNKTTAYGIIPADTLGSELASGTLTVGQKYQITARTDADFTADGAADNVVGTQFVATAATVTLDAGDKVKRVQWGVGEKSFHNGSSFVQNITGLTLSGDTAAVLSIVTDEAEITKAGLAGINPGFKVYKLDNSAGSANAKAIIGGTTGNTNPHSASTAWRVTSGTGRLQFSDTLFSPDLTKTTSAYTRNMAANQTPSSSGQSFIVRAEAASVVYFLLPQLEELPYATSIMPTSGATVTRAATSLSYPTAGNLRGNDVTVGVEWAPAVLLTTAHWLLNCYQDSSNYLGISKSTTSTYLRKVKTGITTVSAQVTDSPTIGTALKVLGKISSSIGLDIFSTGVKGTTGNSDLSNATIGTNITVGGFGDTTGTAVGYLRNLRIYFKPLSDDRCKQLTL